MPFSKGNIPWNKGIKGIHLSPKSELKKGHKLGKKTQFKKGHTPWIKGRNAIWAKKFGKENPNWKGGTSGIEKSIKGSKEWRQWRKSVFERDNYTCQICKVRGKELHPHHIKPFAYFPELRFDVNNGQTLCHSCHRKTDNYGLNGLRLAKKYSVNSVDSENR